MQLIAATNRDVVELERSGALRSDLYHRLNVVRIHLPPLRERGPDRLLLAEEFARAHCARYGVAPRLLAEDARALIERYGWPGNVRELDRQIERIVLLEDDELIRAAHFQVGPPEQVVRVHGQDQRLRLELPASGVSLDALEREALRLALVQAGGNVSQAARFLGLSRMTMIYRMKRHGLRKADFYPAS